MLHGLFVCEACGLMAAVGEIRQAEKYISDYRCQSCGYVWSVNCLVTYDEDGELN